MDKKVTSTFHCVASGQVLKALRAQGDSRSPPTACPKTGTRQRAAFLQDLAAQLSGGTPGIPGGRTRPDRPGRSTVSNRRSAPKDSAIVLNSASTLVAVPRRTKARRADIASWTPALAAG